MRRGNLPNAFIQVFDVLGVIHLSIQCEIETTTRTTPVVVDRWINPSGLYNSISGEDSR